MTVESYISRVSIVRVVTPENHSISNYRTHIICKLNLPLLKIQGINSSINNIKLDESKDHFAIVEISDLPLNNEFVRCSVRTQILDFLLIKLNQSLVPSESDISLKFYFDEYTLLYVLENNIETNFIN